MTIVNLLSALPTVNDLAHFARKVEQTLEGLKLEERESSNYVDGRYFSGSVGSIEIVVALSDEVDHDDLPYWITLNSNDTPEADLVAFADIVVRDSFVPNGFQVARLVSFGRVDEQRLDY